MQRTWTDYWALPHPLGGDQGPDNQAAYGPNILINIGRPICFRIDQARMPIGRGQFCLLSNSEYEHSVSELEGADESVKRYGLSVNVWRPDYSTREANSSASV